MAPAIIAALISAAGGLGAGLFGSGINAAGQANVANKTNKTNEGISQQQQMNNVYNSLLSNASAQSSYNNAVGDSWNSSMGASNGMSNSYNEGGTYGSGAQATYNSLEMMREANAFNAEQARLQREWQEHMSSTAYQRASKDMRLAGINPILAYTQGGASTPAGGQAVSAMGNAYTDSFNYGYGNSKNSSYESSSGGSHSEEHGYSKATNNLRNQLENLAVVSGVQASAIMDMILNSTDEGKHNWGKASGKSLFPW